MMLCLSGIVSTAAATPADGSTLVPFSKPISATIWQQATALTGIDTGPRSASVREVIFFDPNCPMCARQWQQLRPYIDQVRIHWVPVAYIDGSGPDGTSARRAAAILEAKEPETALCFDEDHYDAQHQRGGYAPADHVTDALMADLRRNMSFMTKAGGLGTPTTLVAVQPGQQYVRAMGVIQGEKLSGLINALSSSSAP
ncbi:hypothetical protein [Solimonas marina]|uniref:hypothetical protein n=1 Tax=Solimonas marina TaxID=2714601 RepID=UPI00143CB012|nr:hypothetical protein [Solimonas marina]